MMSQPTQLRNTKKALGLHFVANILTHVLVEELMHHECAEMLSVSLLICSNIMIAMMRCSG